MPLPTRLWTRPSEPDLAMRINGEAPAELARAARDTGALLIHYSTDYVFDGAKEGSYLEDDLPNPISQYGRSKLCGERAIAESGCRYAILRTQWVFGSHGAISCAPYFDWPEGVNACASSRISSARRPRPD